MYARFSLATVPRGPRGRARLNQGHRHYVPPSALAGTSHRLGVAPPSTEPDGKTVANDL
jgi:hypothetical protein